MSDGPLAGRVALVAGGSSPLGAELARCLDEAGAAVAVHYRRNRDAAETIAGACRRGVAVSADLTQQAEVEGLFGTVEEALGPVAILVNAAHPPRGAAAPVAELAPADLNRHLDGVRVHHLLCAGALPAMRSGSFGRIVFVSGALMSRPAPGMSSYGAAKAAAATLTRFVALEEGRHGITANIVAAGRIVSPGEADPEDPTMRELSQRLLERAAFGRFPTYAEVAEAAIALTLPSLSPLTGQTVWVTGGEPIV